MYQARTVFTGSEMPALICSNCGGGPIVAGCCAVAGLSTPATNKATSAAAMMFFFCIVVSPLEFPEQSAETLDTVLDTAAAQRIPDDRLVRVHAIDAEL